MAGNAQEWREETVRVAGTDLTCIQGVLILVDREEDNGLMNIQTELGGDLPVLSVFKRTEIEAYRRHR